MRLLRAVVVGVLCLLPAPASAAPPSGGTSNLDTLLDALNSMRIGGAAMGVGIDVSPLRPWSFFGESPLDPRAGDGRYRIVDPGTAVSLDLKLSWPSAVDVAHASPLQPYVSFGPALLMPETNVRLAGPATDRPVSLGVRAGAGVNWTLDRNATLFGEYRFTHGASETLLPFGVRGPGDVRGFDLLYGVRFRF